MLKPSWRVASEHIMNVDAIQSYDALISLIHFSLSSLALMTLAVDWALTNYYQHHWNGGMCVEQWIIIFTCCRNAFCFALIWPRLTGRSQEIDTRSRYTFFSTENSTQTWTGSMALTWNSLTLYIASAETESECSMRAHREWRAQSDDALIHLVVTHGFNVHQIDREAGFFSPRSPSYHYHGFLQKHHRISLSENKNNTGYQKIMF